MEWISINTKPKEHAQCIVYSQSIGVKVFPAYWDGKEFGNYIGILEWHPYECIKAWQPMPEPPNDL